MEINLRRMSARLALALEHQARAHGVSMTAAEAAAIAANLVYAVNEELIEEQQGGDAIRAPGRAAP